MFRKRLLRALKKMSDKETTLAPSDYSLNNSVEYTSSRVPDVVEPGVIGDIYFVRRNEGQHSDFTYLASTSHVLNKMNEFSEYAEVCKNITRSLWRNHKYNHLYLLFVTERVSKAEFKKKSKEFAVELKELTDAEATRQIAIATNLIGEKVPLTSDDLAFLLEADLETIDRTLTSSPSVPALHG